MADEMDLAALAAGEKDLVQGDFRQANLVGEDLSNRDFTRAQFDKGNLQRSNLSKSVLSEASFTQADLSHANLEGCTGRSNWVHTKLTSANLRNVKFAQSNFHTCDFRDADIRGADFSKANLIHDNDFNGVIANDATKFDGARILRPMARLSIFANYRLQRGELKRIGLGPAYYGGFRGIVVGDVGVAVALSEPFFQAALGPVFVVVHSHVDPLGDGERRGVFVRFL